MTQIVILAAGEGKRMDSSLPKVLHQVHGRPMIDILVSSVMASAVSVKPIIVVGKDSKELIRKVVKDRCKYVIQEQRLGTGHAVHAAMDEIKEDAADNIIVLYGDMPFISRATIRNLETLHSSGGGNVLSMLTLEVDDFKGWKGGFYHFGRIIRDENNKIIRVVELRDSSGTEKKIKELNPSIFCFQAEWLRQNIAKIKNKNAQKEYYLTDLVEIAVSEGREVASSKIAPYEAVGVNTRQELNSIQQI